MDSAADSTQKISGVTVKMDNPTDTEMKIVKEETMVAKIEGTEGIGIMMHTRKAKNIEGKTEPGARDMNLTGETTVEMTITPTRESTSSAESMGSKCCPQRCDETV